MVDDHVLSTVVVTGDVTMDWNLAHRRCGDGPAASWTSEDLARACWQRGGAALLGDLVTAVAQEVGSSIRVLQPDSPNKPPLPNDPRFHHSFALWTVFDKGVWRVQEFLGVDRCRRQDDRNDFSWQRVSGDSSDVDLIVLDDADLGFRSTLDAWPMGLTTGNPRWVILKIARPVAQGPLWQHLLEKFADRLIVVMSIDDLRRTEVQISRRLSWERTAQDVVWELTYNPRVNGLSRCAHTVISFGTSGAILMSRDAPAMLISEPSVMEGGWDENHRGRMIGYTVTLTSAMAGELIRNSSQPDLAQAIQSGVAGMRKLLLNGYGQRSDSRGNVDLMFPITTVVTEFSQKSSPLVAVPIQDPVRFLKSRPESASSPETAGYWTILEDQYLDKLDQVAETIVLEGLDTAVSGVPIGKIGGMTTVDRREIEALRSVQGLIGEYCRFKQKRPLSIAVFGPPGSGKSFGVEQVAKSVCPGEIQSLTFNLSQFADPAALHGALHQVRDVGLNGKIPLVFWDEFDTSLDNQPLGWLRYFLAPMQDGSFQQGELTHPIGRSIFVFAGGTSSRFERFAGDLTEDQRKGAKVPDFISRLKGFLDVLGPNPQNSSGGSDPYHIIRRAILLRSLFERNAPQLFSRVTGKQQLNVDSGVLRALLQTRVYKHGIRSMESIIAMSTLAGKSAFDRSSLPAEPLLDIHVDSLDFLALVQQIVLDDDLTERLAAAAHQVFCDGKMRDGWRHGPEKSEELKTHPLLIAYEELPDSAKEANRVTVRAIPQKLAFAGYVMLPARSNEPPLEFPGDDLEAIATFEHETWMQAKLAAGFTLGDPTPEEPRRNEYLVPWGDLPEPIRQIDRDLVQGIPLILSKAGYAVVKARAPMGNGQQDGSP